MCQKVGDKPYKNSGCCHRVKFLGVQGVTRCPSRVTHKVLCLVSLAHVAQAASLTSAGHFTCLGGAQACVLDDMEDRAGQSSAVGPAASALPLGPYNMADPAVSAVPVGLDAVWICVKPP